MTLPCQPDEKTGKQPPSRYWDQVAREIAQGAPNLLWRSHSDRVNAAWLLRHLPLQPVGNLLKTDMFDESLSEGITPLLARRGCHLWGIDISPATLHLASQQHPLWQTVGSDVRTMPFPTEMFDLIVSISTLDHLENESEFCLALNELYRVLQPGGRLLITLDNRANPFLALRSLLPWELLQRCGLVPYQVGICMGPRRFRRLLQKAGFEVEGMTAILHCPRLLAVPLANRLSQSRQEASGRGLLKCLAGFESLENFPTRYLSGHFLAAVAVKGEVTPGRAKAST